MTEGSGNQNSSVYGLAHKRPTQESILEPKGTNPVAACVVFKNGKPSKKDYRHFNIKTVEGPDDFASMEEVVYRRYKRLLEEEQPLPQLIIIDGH